MSDLITLRKEYQKLNSKYQHSWRVDLTKARDNFENNQQMLLVNPCNLQAGYFLKAQRELREAEERTAICLNARDELFQQIKVLDV